MKTTITRKVTEEIEIKTIEIEIPIDEITEHEPAIPEALVKWFRARDRRHGTEEVWRFRVDLDTGKIEGWPTDAEPIDLYANPRDGGTYRLIGADYKVIAVIEQNYVPHGVIPGEYGDYIDLKIAADGTITNWPKSPDVSKFFDVSNED